VKGDAGVFDVSVDGQLVFSKKQAGRFPQYQEVPNAIMMAGIA
jgi:selT/selW/selH-like putative selenoprotein